MEEQKQLPTFAHILISKQFRLLVQIKLENIFIKLDLPMEKESNVIWEQKTML